MVVCLSLAEKWYFTGWETRLRPPLLDSRGCSWPAPWCNRRSHRYPGHLIWKMPLSPPRSLMKICHPGRGCEWHWSVTRPGASPPPCPPPSKVSPGPDRLVAVCINRNKGALASGCPCLCGIAPDQRVIEAQPFKGTTWVFFNCGLIGVQMSHVGCVVWSVVTRHQPGTTQRFPGGRAPRCVCVCVCVRVPVEVLPAPVREASPAVFLSLRGFRLARCVCWLGVCSSYRTKTTPAGLKRSFVRGMRVA